MLEDARVDPICAKYKVTLIPQPFLNPQKLLKTYPAKPSTTRLDFKMAIGAVSWVEVWFEGSK